MDNTNTLKAELEDLIENTNSMEDLERIRISALGKKGKITALMKDLGYASTYQYAHDFDSGFVPGERYFPQALEDEVFYEPSDRGLELKIKEKLEFLRKANRASQFQRYHHEGGLDDAQ